MVLKLRSIFAFPAPSYGLAWIKAIPKEAHISFNITQGNQILKGIGYNMAQHIGIVKSGKPFDVVFQLQLNEWQGTQTVQMQVLDLKESGSYNN